MSFGNLRVSTRLVLVLAFVNALLVGAIGYGWHAIGRLNGQLEGAIRMQHDFEEATDLARTAQVAFKVEVQEWKDTLLRGQDPDLYLKHWKGFENASRQVEERLSGAAKLLPRLGIPESAAATALAEHAELGIKYREAIKLYKAGDFSSARVVDQAVLGIDRAATEHIGKVVEAVRERGEQADAEVAAAASGESRRLVLGLVVLAAISLVVSGVAGWLLTAHIGRSLRRAIGLARTVASGNLAERIEEVHGNSEFAELQRALRDMNGSLAELVGRVRTSSESVITASSQIAAGNQDLSSRTEEQASSLEETASSIEQMMASVSQSADNSREADELARAAAQVAARGGEAVAKVVHTMGEIHSSSKRIADIIGVIDSIAFQTNILALNAAVEAARAGEQGRGFAVVASEVRTLAQRSAEAAREIKGLITESVQRVDDGAQLANGAGTTMGEVVESVNRVSTIIAAIAAATREQASGISQVSKATSELDKATQQNASLVEESTAASESLRELARHMADSVAVFKLGDGPLAAAPAAPVPPAPRLPAAPAARPWLSKVVPAAHAGLPEAALAAAGDWREF